MSGINQFNFYYRPYVKDIFQSIAAKAGTEPCCDWVCYLVFHSQIKLCFLFPILLNYAFLNRITDRI